MAKAPKPTPLAVTADVIGRAAQTNAIKDLVSLSDAFYRVGVHGPFMTTLPMFCSVFVGGKKQQYRKMNIPIGAKFGTDCVSLGKKQGLIFSFKPHASLSREAEPVERVEVAWDDIINHFGDLSEQIEERLKATECSRALVSEIDTAIKSTIAKNPSMHKILTEGFALAQTHSRQDASDGQMAEIPGFGSF